MSAKVFAEITDDENRKVTLAKKPERVIVMVPSVLNYVDAVGGSVVGRPSSSKFIEIPASMQNVEDVGHVSNINIEKVVGLKPDLIFLNAQLYRKFGKMLDENHISAIVLQPKSYEETKKAIATVGRVYGKTKEADLKLKEMDSRVNAILSKVPENHNKRIVILHASVSTVTVELETSIAGGIAKKLGLINVSAGTPAIHGRPEKAPYSMESLVEQDPDIIFITTLGAKEKIEKRLQADVKNNPAYGALKAARNKRVYALPETLFMLAPGLRYPEAMEMMAKDAFPESFK
ncbi:MAG: ABC transporter substrate-binding protein [Acidaminococcaceae bacterium]|nr:ABC transporter substrate-binding protein [Acidaminococcaceae bacterium]